MFTKYEIIELFRAKGFTVGAEIGTESGHFAKNICIANPQVKLYCIDPYEYYSDYTYYTNETFKGVEYRAHKRMKGYNCEFIKKYSMDAVKDFADESLDFVYIDGNHSYSYVRDDIREWTKRVRKGGIVSGHDYIQEVKQAVDEYVKEHNYILDVTTRKRENPSWMFIKI
jgi:predicted O-methyltransferase YrrM